MTTMTSAAATAAAAPAPALCCAVCEAPGAEWSAVFAIPMCALCARTGAGAPDDRDPVRLGTCCR